MIILLFAFLTFLIIISSAISYTTFGFGPIKALRLYFNSKKTMEALVKPGITVKPHNFSLWEEGYFGDYETEWKFIDVSDRTWSKVEIYFDLNGNITHIDDDRFDRHLDTLELYCRENINFEQFTRKNKKQS
jgi:hypothetical protein